MTEVLPASPDNIVRAAELLREGALVAFGTETVYGLGGDATNATAVAGIYAAKGRPRFNPLISHYPAEVAAFEDVVPNATARALAAAFWPGPLTLVLPRRGSRVSLIAAAGLDTLAVRVPARRDALVLLAAVNRPVAAPSANRSGQVSPTTAAHVLDGLSGLVAAILDSGPCPVGVESTVLDLSGAHPVLLRHGGVTLEAIEAIAGPIERGMSPALSNAPRSPGQSASHYAPALPVRLAARTAAADEGLLAFGVPCPGAGAIYQLSEAADPVEAAAHLFDGLRWLDSEGQRRGLRGIAAMPVPERGLGRAINDRLRRAAAPRG
jgi:L-threonylcarbamoyladenylate synthase